MPRNSQLDSPEELYKYGGLLWQPVFKTDDQRGRRLYTMHGPYCNSCRGDVKSQDEASSLEARCPVCGKSYNLSSSVSESRQQAHAAFQAKLRENFQVISLELPPDVIVHKDENEEYWIEARLGQKNGKLMGIVYMGKKLAEQTKQDYVQMFVDIEDQQLRFDKGNKNPLKLLSRIEAEFEESQTEVTKK